MSEDSVDCTPQLSDRWRKYTKNTLNDKTEESFLFALCEIRGFSQCCNSAAVAK